MGEKRFMRPGETEKLIVIAVVFILLAVFIPKCFVKERVQENCIDCKGDVKVSTIFIFKDDGEREFIGCIGKCRDCHKWQFVKNHRIRNTINHADTNLHTKLTCSECGTVCYSREDVSSWDADSVNPYYEYAHFVCECGNNIGIRYLYDDAISEEDIYEIIEGLKDYEEETRSEPVKVDEPEEIK